MVKVTTFIVQNIVETSVVYKSNSGSTNRHVSDLQIQTIAIRKSKKLLLTIATASPRHRWKVLQTRTFEKKRFSRF